MFVKSLKLVGFKSFADRTRLELRPGVTVVVGPNGSGKSNVVDAIAWVMGTQSTRALRTGKMEDVIFAGTATRPALGRAEVTLVLDNGDGSLPLDLSEVALTRRLYRDGSSDYEINGVACRLLDVQELLSDSGVGRHQHVVVGQGQIDDVLNAGPGDHRAVIEEAAGILKHKLRRERAVRRLERTDGDVVRLRDLLGEISRQMRPLRRQAEAASRRDEVVAGVRALRLYLGGEELRRVGRRLSEIDAAEVRLGGTAADAAAEAQELRSVSGMLAGEEREVDQALRGDTAAAARLETTVERLRRIAQVAQERRRAGQARLEGADERRRDLAEELSDVRDELAAAGEEAAEARRVAEAAEARFRRLADEERSLGDQETMPPEGALAVVRGSLSAQEAAQERDRRELQAVEHRLEVLAGQLDEQEAEVAAAKEEIRGLDGDAVAAQTRYERAERDRRRLQPDWERAEEGHAAATVAVAAARARLEAMEEAAEGFADPAARMLVEEAPGVVGSLGSLLDPPPHLLAAVDAALESWAAAVVFQGGDDLEAAVARLKGAGRGGVPVITRGSVRNTPARTVAAHLGIEALVDLLGAGADQALADSLLGDVVVAEGWAAARRIVEAHPEVRAVTPEGDLVAAHGIRVAHPDGAGPAMMEAGAAALEQAETELARATSRLTAARRAFEDARGVEREALEALEALEARVAGSTEILARLERAVGSVVGERSRLEERRESLVEVQGSRAEEMADLRHRLASLEGEEAERERAWEELAERRRMVARQREAALAAWQEAASSARAAAERCRFLDDRVSVLVGALDEDDPGRVDPVRLDELGLVERRAHALLEVVRSHVELLRRRQAELRARAETTRSRLDGVRSFLERAERVATEARESRAGLAVEAAELRVRLEATAEALRRDADSGEEEALAASRPDSEDPAADLASLEAELRRMGPVNPLAAEEYRQLEERHDFLASQLADLERSREDLRKVIRALDDEIGERFEAAFAEVAAAFEEHVGVLFPGGKGRMRLTDPSEPLVSGVDIEVQPLGKRVNRMTLLSGGERSLAALAFLFAVFRARPSPFYVLDEVEAALDDANLRRFLRLLHGFRGGAQLMIITHQQQTMEIADVLYGVTMEPGGSSKVVAKAVGELSVALSPARVVEAG